MKKQQGIALLMAMLVVSIATVTVVSLTHEQSFTIRQTGNLQNYNTALLYGLSLEDYARIALRKDARDSKIDSLEEDWAKVFGSPIEGGEFGGVLTDAQSLINLNSIISSQEAEKNLLELCQKLDINPDFIPALKDWLDDDLDPGFPDGAEDDYYTALEVPYRTANRLMADVSELRLVKGVTQEIYATLKPFITALPATTQINLNTVTEQKLFEALKLEVDFQAFIDDRDKDVFQSLQDFEQRMNITLNDDQKSNLSVKTDYFLASGQVNLGGKTIHINSVIFRDRNGQPLVLYRSLGEML